MTRLTTALAFAASMLLLALGIANDLVPQGAGESLLIAMPALAVATMRPAKCNALSSLRARVFS